jgi:hypothetical protein
MIDTDLFTHRPLAREDLLDRGISDRGIARLVRDGVLWRVFRGVYLPAAASDTVEARASCLTLVVSPHHVVVDRTAAWLHGIDVFAYAERDMPPPIETCALRGHHPTERQGVRGRSRDLARRDLMTIGGVMVTTPLRTALDLGCHLRRREAMAALNAFARHHGVTKEMLVRELPRYRRRRGVVQLRELASYVDPRPESERESWVLLTIRDAGLPLPEPQYWIEIEGVPTYRLDFAYPRARVCVEYDGADAHDRTPEQREHDRARRRWLRDHNWTVIVVKAGDFTDERLEAWVRELRASLEPAYTTRRW